MRPGGVVLAALVLGLAGATWIACKSSSSGSASGDDGGDDGGSDATQQPEGPTCNPCLQVCACTPGDTYFSPGNCMTVTCGPSGTWGGGGCVGLGCVDATDDGEAGETDATTEVGAEASAEASADAEPESGGEASVDAADAARDASTDVVTDVATDTSAD